MTCMSGNRQFVDADVLVYAHDVTAGYKHNRARSPVEELWETREGCLSVQVLQEFFVTTTRKIPKPLDAPAAAQIIGDLAHWHLHTPAVAAAGDGPGSRVGELERGAVPCRAAVRARFAHGRGEVHHPVEGGSPARRSRPWPAS
jgi:hypothetical protein